ncbi:MAG: hypothetical protein M0P69_11180 [Bacteroidales bacterium]|nr:hypothetical protein [Bacteroidales bacterium]
MFNIEIDDSQIKKFIAKSPQQANWAMKEASAMAGGHYKNWLRRWILSGGRGSWPRLKKSEKSPLKALSNLAHFKVSRVQKTKFKIQIGFFWAKARGTSKIAYAKRKARFRRSFNMSPAQLVRIHEYGRTQRVTRSMRGALAAQGMPLKKSTKRLKTPKREMVGALWRQKKREIPNYIETRFFLKFFDKKNPYNR